MKEQIRINNYKDLIQFIEDPTLTKKEISSVVSQALKLVVFDEGKSKGDLIQKIKNHLNKYKGKGYTGIFLGLPSLDVEHNHTTDAS